MNNKFQSWLFIVCLLSFLGLFVLLFVSLVPIFWTLSAFLSELMHYLSIEWIIVFTVGSSFITSFFISAILALSLYFLMRALIPKKV